MRRLLFTRATDRQSYGTAYVTPLARKDPIEVHRFTGVFGVAATRTAIYWVTWHGIDTARLRKGSVVRPLVTRLNEPRDLLIAGNYLYWTDFRAIGRVRLDGAELDKRFIRLPWQRLHGKATRATGVAQDIGTDGSYLYFGRCFDGYIGRVPLTVKANYHRISWRMSADPDCPQEIAVANGYVYWSNGADGIGRTPIAHPDAAETDWVRTVGAGPFNLIAANKYVYWVAGYGPGGNPSFIGRVGTDGRHRVSRWLAGQEPMAIVP